MKCKPGDLALIMISDFPENIGSLVECLEIDPDSCDSWLVKTTTPGPAVDLETGIEEWSEAGDVCVVEDSRLQPIRGENVKQQELEIV